MFTTKQSSPATFHRRKIWLQTALDKSLKFMLSVVCHTFSTCLRRAGQEAVKVNSDYTLPCAMSAALQEE